MPLLFIEVDNCHETAEELALKLEKYARFFRRTAKDTDGKERPMWRTRWTVPEYPYGEAPHPPVLLVFNHIGERNPDRTIPRLQELTRHLWQGERQRGGHHLYDRKIPIIAVALPNLREHGQAGPVFLRFGRDHLQPLLEAIGNPRFEAAQARAAEEARTRAAAYQEQVRRAAQARAAKQAAEREARRPVCADCGAKFTDARWDAIQPAASRRPLRLSATRIRTRPCPSRSPAAPGSPASAADVRRRHRPGRSVLPGRCRYLRLLPGLRKRVPKSSEPVRRVGEELVHQPVGHSAGSALNGAVAYRGGHAGTDSGLLRGGRGVGWLNVRGMVVPGHDAAPLSRGTEGSGHLRGVVRGDVRRAVGGPAAALCGRAFLRGLGPAQGGCVQRSGDRRGCCTGCVAAGHRCCLQREFEQVGRDSGRAQVLASCPAGNGPFTP
ncbi:hypothetical protein ACIPPN_30775 [Streptomyces diastaticus]|uniref:hypothetical protein n=1 Tax=Streptomyces diastaticus TaxID=1956 RepID=UPI003412CA7E